MADKKNEWIIAWPLSTYFAAYIDPKKSLPHINNGVFENRPGYPFWIPEQRYLANVNDYIDVASQIEHDEFIVEDPFLGKPIIKYWVEKGKSAIWDGKLGNGMILLQYTKDLTGYRKRDDGLLGLHSISQHLDTRLSIAEDLKHPGKFPEEVPKTNTANANFSNLVKLKVEHDKKVAAEEAEKKAKQKAHDEYTAKISAIPEKKKVTK